MPLLQEKPAVKRLTLENVGPIKHADIKFGDLTILVGPQATGKTVFLQTLKLFEDVRSIVRILKANDWYWEKNLNTFLQLFYGEGMDYLINDKSKISMNSKEQSLLQYISRGYEKQEANCFYIPAQRYTTLENGWPRSFNNYIERTPYVMREFGDVLNAKLQNYKEGNKHLFPMEGKIGKAIKSGLESSIFENAKLSIKMDVGNYKIELSPHGGSESIPLNAASAGQREFAPYLYGLYYLLPAGKVLNIKGVNTVIIEELEMGLHPKAIGDAFLSVLDLLSRGYRVVMSTHSPVMIDYVWALVEYQKSKKNIPVGSYLIDLFGIKTSDWITRLNVVVEKNIKLYYFKPTGKYASSITSDISSLDLFAENDDVSSWGDLTSFSTHVGDIISQLTD
jgi:AAA15 family ATPase/GTPase